MNSIDTEIADHIYEELTDMLVAHNLLINPSAAVGVFFVSVAMFVHCGFTEEHVHEYVNVIYKKVKRKMES